MTPDSPSAAPLFRACNEVAIHVPDLAAARKFYGQALGLPCLRADDDLLEFDAGAIRLYVNREAGEPRSFIPSLTVADAAAAKAHLVASGCTIVREYPDGAGFYFRDPLGFVLDVVERAAASTSVEGR